MQFTQSVIANKVMLSSRSAGAPGRREEGGEAAAVRCVRLAQYTLRRARVVAALLGRLATLPEAVVCTPHSCDAHVAASWGACRCCQRLPMLRRCCLGWTNHSIYGKDEGDKMGLLPDNISHKLSR